MSVLVTGGLGAIGSWAVRELVARGERPVVIDAREDLRLVRDVEGRFDLVVGDIADADLLESLAAKHAIDRVCHLAAVMPPAAQSDPAFGFRVNAAATVSMLEFARKKGLRRFVYTSSKAIYGPPTGKYAGPGYAPIPEDHPFNPQNVYGVTKLAGELMVRQFESVYGLDVAVLRLTSTYGPGKVERHGAVGLVSRLIEEAYAGRSSSVVAREGDRADYVYNRDVGRAAVLAAFADAPTSRVYNIGTGKSLSMRDIVANITAQVPGSTIELAEPKAADSSASSGSVLATVQAERELGFVAEYDFAAGLNDYLACLDARPMPAERS